MRPDLGGTRSQDKRLILYVRAKGWNTKIFQVSGKRSVMINAVI